MIYCIIYSLSFHQFYLAMCHEIPFEDCLKEMIRGMDEQGIERNAIYSIYTHTPTHTEQDVQRGDVTGGGASR